MKDTIIVEMDTINKKMGILTDALGELSRLQQDYSNELRQLRRQMVTLERRKKKENS